MESAMEMAFKIRASKFRHVYGKAYRKEASYENIRITRNAHDSSFCCVNPNFLAVVTESGGGGSFVVLPLEKCGRVDINTPRVCGHAGAILDIKWNPFNDHIIASCSEDSTVKIWQIPEQGLTGNLSDWLVDMHGHHRRIGYLEWHPTADNILLSAGFDYKCLIWNIEQAEPVNVINCHRETIFSISWNHEGSLFATTSKDKKLRVIDPRTASVVAEADTHNGSKASKNVFISNHKIFTTGFARTSARQYALWDIRNMSAPQHQNDIDSSSGVLMPYFDYDTNVMFIPGKGDGNIRYYEIVDESPYIHYLSEYMSSSPQRGLGVMPKRGCDINKCEIVRFYKLHAGKNLVEPISMIVPRKSEKFQPDIFPPTASSVASLSADEWISGQNREPIVVSLEDGSVTNTPKITTSKAVQKQDGVLQQAPMITTYKAMNRTRASGDWRSNRPNTIASETVPNNMVESMSEPASVKNIKRLSYNEDYVTIRENQGRIQKTKSMFEGHDSEVPPSPPPPTEPKQYQRKMWSPTSPVPANTTVSLNGINCSDSEPGLSPLRAFSSPLSPLISSLEEFSSMTSRKQEFCPLISSHQEYSPLTSSHQEFSPMQPDSSDFSSLMTPVLCSSDNDALQWQENAVYVRKKRQRMESATPPSSQTNGSFAKLVIDEVSPRSHDHKIHIQKVWHAHQPVHKASETRLHGDPELKKAYFQQQEEVRSLKEQIKLKDKRINQLEDELRLVREGSCSHRESNC
ncbi:coronin-2B-like isoform X3 [Gigantopelta aegis]|uniref:coronin-2B-like isoform X3 n=1 Tax=Gigantopelta aegis TaxID=1735272 RepID=UPI001B889D3A|nr:coronin-2B-like isoform X3 [Gigantopelta aegis]